MKLDLYFLWLTEPSGVQSLMSVQKHHTWITALPNRRTGQSRLFLILFWVLDSNLYWVFWSSNRIHTYTATSISPGLQEMGKEENRLDPQIFHEELTVRRENAEIWWWWSYWLQILWMPYQNWQPPVPMPTTTTISTPHSVHHQWSTRHPWSKIISYSET